MGSIGSVLTAADFLTKTASFAMQATGNSPAQRQSKKQNELALAQLKAQQDLQMRNIRQNAALDREKIALEAQSAESERLAALRRAVSRQRASFGAQGVGSAGGSSQAVLLGLFDESDAEKQKREQLDGLRLSAIDQTITQQKNLNLLQREQLAQKNKVGQLSISDGIISKIL